MASQFKVKELRKYIFFVASLQVKVSSLVSSTLVHNILKAPWRGVSPKVHAVLLRNHERAGVRPIDFFRVSAERRAPPRDVGR